MGMLMFWPELVFPDPVDPDGVDDDQKEIWMNYAEHGERTRARSALGAGAGDAQAWPLGLAGDAQAWPLGVAVAVGGDAISRRATARPPARQA